MSTFQTLYRLFFPPRCLTCRELMRLDRVKGRLCRTCAPLWENATHTQCKDCFLPYFDCRCVLPQLARVGVQAHVKLVPYDERENEHKAIQRMVLNMKTSTNEKLFSFLASELSVGVRQTVEARERARAKDGLVPLPTVIAYLPRAKRVARVTGVDQAKRLALSLSRVTGFQIKHAIRRRRDPLLPQKSLTAKARLGNIKGVFSPGESVTGMRVLLVDDIVTTGVSVSEAARVLQKSGACEVIVVSVAATARKRNVKYRRC